MSIAPQQSVLLDFSCEGGYPRLHRFDELLGLGLLMTREAVERHHVTGSEFWRQHLFDN